MPLSLEELDRLAAPCDFRRPDRIPKHQLRAIHALHDNFARNLAASLSAYLRAYATVSLASVEQLSFGEFSRGLPSPTCLVSLSMKPYDGNAMLEINPSLVFPVIEMLLGGTGKSAGSLNRALTEIEQRLLEGLHRVVLQDLRRVWQPVAAIGFTIESRETDPQLLQLMSPNEAVVAIGLAIRVGESSGRLNLGLPSLVVKMLGQKFDQQWFVKKSDAGEEEQRRTLRLLKAALLQLEVRLEGPALRARDLMELRPGDVLAFDYPLERPLTLTVNGKKKGGGRPASRKNRKAFVLE